MNNKRSTILLDEDTPIRRSSKLFLKFISDLQPRMLFYIS